jgi:hypothetical protein
MNESGFNGFTGAVRLAAVAASAILASCLGERVAGGTGVGNPPLGSATIALVASPSPSPALKPASGSSSAGDSGLYLSDGAGMQFHLKSCVANVGYIRIKLPDGITCRPEIPGCETDRVELEGPLLADLLAGTLAPDPGAMTIPVGSYNRVEIRFEAPRDDAPNPDPALRESSMHLSGTFAYAGRTDRTFDISLDFDEEVRFDSGSMAVRENSDNDLRIRFAVEKWLADADIGDCLADGRLALDSSGNLRIDESSNCGDLEGILKAGIKASGTLDKDIEESGEAEGGPSAD